MGQRLVVNIIANDEILANAYYHWSAYTESAAYITKEIVNKVVTADYVARTNLWFKQERLNSEEHNKLTAFILLENTGAGLLIDDKEKECFEKLTDRYNYRIGNNRSDGLISLTPDNIKQSIDSAEFVVDIDISNDTVTFRVFNIENESGISEYINEEVITKEDIKELDFDDIDQFNFDQVDTWYEKIKEMCSDYSYPYFKAKNEPIYYQVIA